MAVNQEPDSEVTAETELDEIDGGHTAYFMASKLKRIFPRHGNCNQKLRSRDGLQVQDAHSLWRLPLTT